MLLIDNCLLERQGGGGGAMERWAEREERKESARRGNVYKREEWMGEVGDGGKEGDRTREEGAWTGFRRYSEIEKELLLSTPFCLCVRYCPQFFASHVGLYESSHSPYCLTPVYTSIRHHYA